MRRTLLPATILSVVALFGGHEAMAQQDPYYTHFAFNKILYNPAVAGLGGKWCVNGISHWQYRGFTDQTFDFTTPGAPSKTAVEKNVGPNTNGLGLSIPLPPFNAENKKTGEMKDWGGIGISAFNDAAAYFKQTSIKIAAAGRFAIGQGQKLSVGVEANVLQYGFNFAKLRPLQPGDPNIPTNSQSDQQVTIGAGLYYNNDNFKKFYLGVSGTNLTKRQFMYNSGLLSISNAPHVYLVTGMEFESFLGNPSLRLNPSLLVKNFMETGGLGRWQVDASAIATYQEKFAGGLAFRTERDALSLLFGYFIKNDAQSTLRVGYSYDITGSRIQLASNGTHELQVNYCCSLNIPPPPPPIIILTPRYMNRDRGIE